MRRPSEIRDDASVGYKDGADEFTVVRSCGSSPGTKRHSHLRCVADGGASDDGAHQRLRAPHGDLPEVTSEVRLICIRQIQLPPRRAPADHPRDELRSSYVCPACGRTRGARESR